MKMPVAVIALSGLIISAAACAPSADQEPAAGDAASASADTPSAEAAIAESSVAWAAAWNAGDGAAVAALYSADGMLFPPGGDAVEGREAIAAFWQAEIDAAEGASVTLETKEVQSSGDGAVEVGAWVVTGAEGEHLDHGKYVVAWEYVDGSWQMARDIWNSSMEEMEE